MGSSLTWMLQASVTGLPPTRAEASTRMVFPAASARNAFHFRTGQVTSAPRMVTERPSTVKVVCAFRTSFIA